MYTANKLYPGLPDDADYILPTCILAFSSLERQWHSKRPLPDESGRFSFGKSACKQ